MTFDSTPRLVGKKIHGRHPQQPDAISFVRPGMPHARKHQSRRRERLAARLRRVWQP